MPRDNYGFRGDALTPAAAIAIGASVSSQEYQYAVQLGVVTPVPEPPAGAVFTAFPAIGHWGRSLSGVGTNVATLTRNPAAVGYDYNVHFTVSEPTLVLWQSAVTTPTPYTSSSTLVQYTLFPVPGAYLDKSGYYIWGIPEHQRYRASAWNLPQAGTYSIRVDAGYYAQAADPVEGTFTLIQQPAIVQFYALQGGSGRPVWTQSSRNQVTYYQDGNMVPSFSLPATTLTITRAGSPNYAGYLLSNSVIPGASLDKYGTYSLRLPSTNTAVSGSVALPAGRYSYGGVAPYIPVGSQVTFSIP